jgi:hypothetical protein
MSFMDTALGVYKPPTADDIEIDVPFLHGRKKEPEAAAETPELGQHGGGADGASEAHNDASGGGAAEPAPQRDDPDDGEHTDSTEQAVEARAAAAAAKAAAQAEDEDPEPEVLPTEVTVEDEVTVEEDEADDVAEIMSQLAAEEKKTQSVRQVLADIPGSSPRTFQKTGFSSGGVETLSVTRFPQPLVDRLRLALAPAVGGEFAEALSSAALITAFLIAKTGLELDVDANTSVAVDVFRQVDPRLLAIEEKMDETMSDVLKLADAMKLSLKRISDTAKVVDTLDFSMSYLIADRVAGLTTTDTDETNVDVAQKKVLVARERIQKRAKEQRQIERERAGRRLS